VEAEKVVSQRIILSHDGNVDDLVVQAYLLVQESVELAAVIVTDADCFALHAVNCSAKINNLLASHHIPVSLSGARGKKSLSKSLASACDAYQPLSAA
jgi:inosine-uridine nucleoside N-ribohydrolase